MIGLQLSMHNVLKTGLIDTTLCGFMFNQSSHWLLEGTMRIEQASIAFMEMLECHPAIVQFIPYGSFCVMKVDVSMQLILEHPQGVFG